MIKHRESEQVETVGVSSAAIMRTKDFALGVDDRRTGHPPRFDDYSFDQDDGHKVARDQTNGCWNYERGRCWASIAPQSMPLMIDGRLNPKALRLYQLASERGYTP